MSMAREVTRQQRVNAAAKQRQFKENERFEKQRARENARVERHNFLSQREAEKDARQRYLEDREVEAQTQTADIEEQIEGLQNILTDTLAVDDTINFEGLRVIDRYPDADTPSQLINVTTKPSLETFLTEIVAPGVVAKLIPGAKARHAKALNDAKDRFQMAMVSWTSAEKDRSTALNRYLSDHARSAKEFQDNADQRNADVDEFKANYYARAPDAVIAYNSMVLERSSYPEAFPHNFSIAYTSASRQLVIEFELPTPSIVPAMTEYRYVKNRDVLEGKSRKPSEIKELYQDVIAALALRTIHEVFEADQAEAIDTCCFNGYVHTVDPATGNDTQPHLISVRTTKDKFLPIKLARVDKATCLRNLGAQVSRHAAEAQPVKPIIEFDMADARFIDQADMVSGLGSAPNLMDMTPSEFEHLVANLFGKMGLESKLTRSSRDGGVDCIAYDPRPVLGGKVVIQAKRYRHTVGVSAVRDLYGTMMNEGANKGILVATSGYGPDAFNFASDKPIELIDGGALLYLLQEVGTTARIIFPTSEHG